MLRFLEIRNLAVIESVEIEFEEGLNVLTGETGAGKSILVEAVGLLLGGRASPDLVRTGEDCATLQAIFEHPDTGEELLLRREITAQGRSRAFVNGTLATAAALRDLSNRLVDLHGQHEHQALLDPESHLDLLDRFAGLDDTRREAAANFERVQSARQALDAVQAAERQRAARTELIEFQVAELDRAQPKAGEDEELQALRTLLANAEKVRRLCDESYSILYDRDEAVLGGLGQVWRRVGELAALDPKFEAYLEARDAIKSQLEDLAAFLRSYASTIDASPSRLQDVEDRLAILERLKRKHGPLLSDVVGRHRALHAELASLESLDEQRAIAQRELGLAEEAYLSVARRLSKARRSAAGRFGQALVRQLADLAMTHTRFEVRFGAPEVPPERWGPRGLDEGEFYVSPNPGEDLRPLARIVSGGEMSRIMLGIKSLASIDDPGKTLIFDEVDAGIGGRVADAVGGKLRLLGTDFQVLCITHLPQIAAYGTSHYLLEKRVSGGRTITKVRRIRGQEREEEIARMLGGAQLSASTRRTAAEMLDARRGESESGGGAKAKARN